jgi:N-acetylglucosaminyldiphosphoundecaprenol N-acetyl-beta-D-mannosaminyltransferase
MTPGSASTPRAQAHSSTLPQPAIRLLGVRIDALRLGELLQLVQQTVSSGGRVSVMYVNIHCMNVAADDPEYAESLEAANVVYCDGTGVRIAARLVGKHLPQRMTGADWIDDLCRMASREGLGLFLLGGADGIARDAAERLTNRHPGLQIAGTAGGYRQGDFVIGHINDLRPDILLVGMGTPTQEKWISEHRAELNVPVVWAVGALLDFVTGRIPRGPRWMTDHGLEWLCRLTAEPRKLWRRYLFGNPRFLWRLVLSRWAGRA